MSNNQATDTISRRTVLKKTAVGTGIILGGAAVAGTGVGQSLDTLPIYSLCHFCGLGEPRNTPYCYGGSSSDRPAYFYSLSGKLDISGECGGSPFQVTDASIGEPCHDYAWIQFEDQSGQREGYLGPLYQGEAVPELADIDTILPLELIEEDGHPTGELPGILCEESLEVDISIKPGEEPNPINPRSRGTIPVAILQTDDFNPVEEVDVGTLRFGPPDVIDDGNGASPIHGGHAEDVDNDGDDDLVVHFAAEDAGFQSEDEEGRVVGETTDGIHLSGTDSVRVVGN